MIATNGSKPRSGLVAHHPGQPILGIDAGPEVGADGCEQHDHDSQQHSRHTDQRLTHPHIVAYPLDLRASLVTVPVRVVTAPVRMARLLQTVPVCIVTAPVRMARLLLRPCRSASSPRERPGCKLSFSDLAVKLRIPP